MFLVSKKLRLCIIFIHFLLTYSFLNICYYLIELIYRSFYPVLRIKGPYCVCAAVWCIKRYNNHLSTSKLFFMKLETTNKTCHINFDRLFQINLGYKFLHFSCKSINNYFRNVTYCNISVISYWLIYYYWPNINIAFYFLHIFF